MDSDQRKLVGFIAFVMAAMYFAPRETGAICEALVKMKDRKEIEQRVVKKIKVKKEYETGIIRRFAKWIRTTTKRFWNWLY